MELNIYYKMLQLFHTKWIFLLYMQIIIINSNLISVNANIDHDPSFLNHNDNVGEIQENQEQIWEYHTMDDKKAWDLSSGPWLGTFEDTAKSWENGPDYMQGDDPGGGNLIGIPTDPDAPIKCPPVPETSNTLACILPNCTENMNCDLPFQLCCDNGCVKTCLTGVKDSIVLDWEVQPLAIDEEKYGDAWLIHDDLQNDVETKDARNPRNQLEPGSCLFEMSVIPDGTDFVFETHPCTCLDGAVTCNVYGDVPHGDDDDSPWEEILKEEYDE